MFVESRVSQTGDDCRVVFISKHICEKHFLSLKVISVCVFMLCKVVCNERHTESDTSIGKCSTYEG